MIPILLFFGLAAPSLRLKKQIEGAAVDAKIKEQRLVFKSEISRYLDCFSCLSRSSLVFQEKIITYSLLGAGLCLMRHNNKFKVELTAAGPVTASCHLYQKSLKCQSCCCFFHLHG